MVGVERSDSDGSQIGFYTSQGLSATVDSIDLMSGRVALAYALNGVEGDYGIKASADRLLPALRRSPRARAAGPRVPVRLAGLALSAAVALAFAGPWLRDMKRSGLTRENYRGRSLAFPAGAVLLACSLVALAPLALLDDRADLDLLDPELRRWAVYVLGRGAAGAARRRARPRGGGGRPARLARPLPGRRSPGGSRPGRSRASEPWRSPPTPSPGGGARASTISPTWRCCS